ncbi:MAG: hypothetical protein ACJ790_18560 [Myxococcaceae bacterium]
MLLSAIAPLLLAAVTPTTNSLPQFHLEARPGQVRFEAGVLSEPYTQDLKEAARRYLSTRKDLALPATSTLVNPQIMGTWFGATVHFTQSISGVEVDGAQVAVTFDAQKRVIQLTSGIEPYETITGYSLSAQKAMQLAARAINGTLMKADGTPYGGSKKLYFVRGNEARAGYLVWAPNFDMTHNWYVGVDAATGAILFKQDRVLHVNNAYAANVYQRSPGGRDAGVGITPTQTVTLEHVDGENDGGFDDGGFLNGTQFLAWGCCTTEGCKADAGPARVQGTYNFGGQNIPYDVAVCDRLQRATNLNNIGYEYAPVDPPNPVCGSGGCTVRLHDPADEDPFAEVNAYYHVNEVYDYVRTLSVSSKTLYPSETIPPFQLRDAANGKIPSVWTNAVLPNQSEAISSLFGGSPVATANTMVHLDNAAFLPHEEMGSLGLPANYLFDTDALIIWQGDKADFAYDAPVLWHEFGHGMLYSAVGLKFDTVGWDSRSANNEGGALHEGLADYLAVSFGQNPEIGQYVGVRIDTAGAPAGTTTTTALRDASGSNKCPDSLWGEVHEDGQHVTQSLWEARKEIFQGNDQGRTFDAAVYAAIVSMVPTADFAIFAAAMNNHIQQAFPNVQQAQQKMAAVFDSRGVTNCSKVFDMTNVSPLHRDVFIIQAGDAAGLAQSAQIPGPYQFKFSVPNGAKSVSVSFPVQSSPFGGTQIPALKILAKSGSPITFNKGATDTTNDADSSGNAASATGGAAASATVNVPCGGDLYVALSAAGGPQLQNLSFAVTPQDTCVVDSGVPDAGTTTKVPAITEGGAGSGGSAAKTGCGCGATDAGMMAFAAIALCVAMMRRRARR